MSRLQLSRKSCEASIGGGAWPSVSFPSWRYDIAASASRVCFSVQSTTIGRRAQRPGTEIGSSRYGRCGSFSIEFCSRLSWIVLQFPAGLTAQFRIPQPVEGEQRAFQPPQLAQRRGEAVLPRVGGELTKDQGGLLG